MLSTTLIVRKRMHAPCLIKTLIKVEGVGLILIMIVWDLKLINDYLALLPVKINFPL